MKLNDIVRPLAIVFTFSFAPGAVLAQDAASTLPPLRVTHMTPDVVWSNYSGIIVSPLDVTDTKLLPPPWGGESENEGGSLEPEVRSFLSAAYLLAVREGIEAGGELSVDSERAAGTLQLDVRLVSITPWSRRGEAAITRGFGSLIFEAEVKDATSGELLAAFVGKQDVGETYQENTDINRALNLALHFYGWGLAISERISSRTP